jgi:hypothetical protein
MITDVGGALVAAPICGKDGAKPAHAGHERLVTISR